MDLALENILIILLSALTIIYFFVGLIGTYFFGSSKTKMFGLIALAMLVIIVVSFILRGSSTGTEHLGSAIALGLFFLVIPIATFTAGIFLSNTIIKFFKRAEVKPPKI